MQLGLLVLAMLYLTSTGHSDLKLSSGRRQRRISTEDPPSCSSGCERCSEYNGCFRCRPRLFILLERNDIRQMGVCLSSCPVGYYGMRTPETNRCIQCKIENCEACFNRNFCTKCKEGLYSHRGRCFLHCPDGLSTTNGTMECVECELGEWSAWGPCMKNEKTCGFKKGTQSRVRGQAQTPSPETPSTPSSSQPCSPPTETRRCVVQRTACEKGGRKKKEKKKERESGGRKEGGQPVRREVVRKKRRRKSGSLVAGRRGGKAGGRGHKAGGRGQEEGARRGRGNSGLPRRPASPPDPGLSPSRSRGVRGRGGRGAGGDT